MQMALSEFIKAGNIVPAIWPVDLNTGANAGDFISMKNYGKCLIVIQIGVSGGTIAVTLDKSADVSGGTTTLAFTKYYRTGQKLKITNKNGLFTVGETITGGTSGATGVVKISANDHLWLHTVTATAFSDAETITGGTSGYTATVDGTAVNEDILLEDTATSNTFTIPAVSNRIYAIPIDAEALGAGYDCIQLDLAQASGQTFGGAFYLMLEPRNSRMPMDTAIYD